MPYVAINAIAAIIFIIMRKKPPGEKNISTGVSLPPDLYDWVVSRANEPSHDPTLSRSTSRIVKQALVEYRDRIEAEDREMALRAAETPERVAPAKKNKVGKYLTAAERKRARAGAKTISPSASSGTLSSMAGTGRSLRAG